MVGIPAVAAIIGALIAKRTIAALTRKMNMIIACVMMIVGSFIMLIPYEEALFIGRILEGAGLGIEISVATVYLR